MNKLFCLSCLLMVLCDSLFSQECNEATVTGTAGKWTEGVKGSVGSTSATELAKEKAVVAVIQSMLQHYKPVGADADFNGVYYSSINQPLNTFGYVVRIMPFICNGNKIARAHETNTSVTISANEIGLGAEVYQPFKDASAWDFGFRSIQVMPEAKDGGYYWEEERSLGFGMRGTQRTWLITSNGQLPFSLVSKKEFLERKRQKLLKGKTEEDIKGVDEAVAVIDKMLKMPAAELSEPAVVKQDSSNFLLHVFTDTNDPMAAILIKPNPAYFDKKLPRSSPQFFSIVLKENDKNPVMMKAMRGIEQAIDKNELKALLGK